MEQPHGNIQWKGSQVCVDFQCSCGRGFHVDDEFMYYVRCPHCKTVFECHTRFDISKVHDLATWNQVDIDAIKVGF